MYMLIYYFIPFSFLKEIYSWLSLPLPSLTHRPLKTWKLSYVSLTLCKFFLRWSLEPNTCWGAGSAAVSHCKLNLYHHLLDIWCTWLHREICWSCICLIYCILSLKLYWFKPKKSPNLERKNLNKHKKETCKMKGLCLMFALVLVIIFILIRSPC